MVGEVQGPHSNPVSLAFAMLALSAVTRREQPHRLPRASECILPPGRNRAADLSRRLTAVLEQTLRQGVR